MKVPGVNRRPLVNIADKQEFNEVFFDNVWVRSEKLIGEENMYLSAVANLIEYDTTASQRSSIAARGLGLSRS
ncbi:MAG: hypothetical protein ACR2PL_28235 [Dehalococcoidia bacterium]